MRRNINPHGVTHEHYQLAEVAQQQRRPAECAGSPIWVMLFGLKIFIDAP